MPGGRPANPPEIKELNGNPGRRPFNKNYPSAPVGLPPCPAHLDDYARTLWNSLGKLLAGMRTLTEADAVALEMLCVAYSEYRHATDIILGDGTEANPGVGLSYATVNESGSAMYRARPEVAIRADAWRRVSSMLGQFGITPATRHKIHALGDGEKPTGLAGFSASKPANVIDFKKPEKSTKAASKKKPKAKTKTAKKKKTSAKKKKTSS